MRGREVNGRKGCTLLATAGAAGILLLSLPSVGQVSREGDVLQLHYPGMAWAVEMSVPGLIQEGCNEVDPFKPLLCMRAVNNGQGFMVSAHIEPVGQFGGAANPAGAYADELAKSIAFERLEIKAMGAVLEWAGFQSPDADMPRYVGQSGMGSGAEFGNKGFGFPMPDQSISKGFNRMVLWAKDGLLVRVHLFQAGLFSGYVPKDRMSAIADSIRFVDVPGGGVSWRQNGGRIENAVLGYAFALPEGWTLKGDKRGLYAEARDPQGQCTMVLRTVRLEGEAEEKPMGVLRHLAEREGMASAAPLNLPFSGQRTIQLEVLQGTAGDSALLIGLIRLKGLQHTFLFKAPEANRAPLTAAVRNILGSFAERLGGD